MHHAAPALYYSQSFRLLRIRQRKLLSERQGCHDENPIEWNASGNGIVLKFASLLGMCNAAAASQVYSSERRGTGNCRTHCCKHQVRREYASSRSNHDVTVSIDGHLSKPRHRIDNPSDRK